MTTRMTFGEYVRRLRRSKRWQLQDVADATGLSLSHLSRIENDAVVPNAETVVRLSKQLDGDLNMMLELADCLPQEILERLVRRAGGSQSAMRRSAGPQEDREFARALMEEIDPNLRKSLADQFGLSERDVDGIFTVLKRMASMTPTERDAILAFLAPRLTEVDREA